MEQWRKTILDIADHLEGDLVPEKGNFDMRDWGAHKGDHEPSEDNYCGTTACLAGWLALHPKYENFRSSWTKAGYRMALVPEGLHSWDYMAVMAFGEKAGRILSQAFQLTMLSKEEVVKFLRDKAGEENDDS